jgi:hypothetical protein
MNIDDANGKTLPTRIRFEYVPPLGLTTATLAHLERMGFFRVGNVALVEEVGKVEATTDQINRRSQ